MAPRKTDKRAQARRCHSMAVRVQVVIVSRERTAVEGARQLDHRYMQAFARLALPRARAIAVHIEHHERTTAPNASLAHDGLHIAVSARTRRVEGKLVGVCAVVLECAMYEGGVPCTIHTVRRGCTASAIAENRSERWRAAGSAVALGKRRGE
eukprot:scaffold13820_cov87-Phaeocystis_antarctica.AAC.3